VVFTYFPNSIYKIVTIIKKANYWQTISTRVLDVTSHLLVPSSRFLIGAILLDLEQNTLPGIVHLVVETMIISDQIRAEDRPNVLRALLLKHRSANHADKWLFHFILKDIQFNASFSKRTFESFKQTFDRI